MALVLHGLEVSVYTRVVRMALALKGVQYRLELANPFETPPDGRVSATGRIPVLEHEGFILAETAAIVDYLDAEFPQPRLRPEGAAAIGRSAQVRGIVDSAGYWPMVRQVFSHGVFQPLRGQPADPAEVAEGLAASAPVLAALEQIAEEGHVLNRTKLTQADLHLAPMIAYFAMEPRGRAMLDRHPALARWCEWMAHQPCFERTDPGLRR